MFLRPIARYILKKVSLMVLQKHKPDVICVTGDGDTALFREQLFLVLSKKVPVRRTLESPESEFTVPFTIYGNYSHPTNVYTWVTSILKILMQIARLKPYFHVLILEIPQHHSAIFDYWIKVLNPKFIVKVPAGLDLITAENKTKNFLKLAGQILEGYNISFNETARLLENSQLPNSKIKIEFSGPLTIVDARHYYYPVNITSVLEVARTLGSEISLFTTIPSDLQLTESNGLTINPKVKPKLGVVVLRGHRSTKYAI